MSDKKDKKSQKNKGVRARLEQKPENETSEEDTTNCKSINKVKEEVKTVIELMGPNTPHLNTQSSSNMADNEESFYSNTTDFNQEKSKKEIESNEITENECTDRTLPPEMTLQEDTDYSIIAARNSAPEAPTNESIQHPQMICPPPWLPPNVMFGSECLCPQIASYLQNSPGCNGEPGHIRQANTDGNIFANLLKSFKGKCANQKVPKKCEYYTMNIKSSSSTQGIPKRLVFDLVDDMPEVCEECHCVESGIKKKCRNVSEKKYKDFNNKQIRREDIYTTLFPPNRPGISKDILPMTPQSDLEKVTRVDVYYFDHGNANYLRTTDRPPKLSTDGVAEKTEAYTTIFWAEIFGTINIGVSFCTSFILQLIRFILYSLLRPLTIGLLQLISDYFFKPCLTTTFNGLIQPPLTFLYNVLTTLRDLCEPIAKGIGYFLKEISNLVKSFRIMEVFQVKDFSEGNGTYRKSCKDEKNCKAQVI